MIASISGQNSWQIVWLACLTLAHNRECSRFVRVRLTAACGRPSRRHSPQYEVPIHHGKRCVRASCGMHAFSCSALARPRGGSALRESEKKYQQQQEQSAARPGGKKRWGTKKRAKSRRTEKPCSDSTHQTLNKAGRKIPSVLSPFPTRRRRDSKPPLLSNPLRRCRGAAWSNASRGTNQENPRGLKKTTVTLRYKDACLLPATEKYAYRSLRASLFRSKNVAMYTEALDCCSYVC